MPVPLLMLQLRQPDKLSRLVAAHGLLKSLVSGAEKILPKALLLGTLQTLWRDVVRSKADRAAGIEILTKHTCERLVLLFWSRRHLHRLEQLEDKHVIREARAYIPTIFRVAAGYPVAVDPKAYHSIYLRLSLAALATELHKRDAPAGRKALLLLSEMPPPFGDWSKPVFCADDWIDPGDEVIHTKKQYPW